MQYHFKQNELFTADRFNIQTNRKMNGEPCAALPWSMTIIFSFPDWRLISLNPIQLGWGR